MTWMLQEKRREAVEKGNDDGLPIGGHMAKIISFPDINTTKTSGWWNHIKFIFGSNEQAARRAGKAAENNVSYVLQKYLPDEYLIVSNYPVDVNGNHQDIDHIVFGPNIIFCIETKAISGIIIKNQDGFLRITSDNWGNFFNKRMGNPEGQVKSQVHALKTILINSGLRGWITPIVCFTSADFKINTESPVSFVNLKDLVPFILEFPAKKSCARRTNLEEYTAFFEQELRKIMVSSNG